MSRAPKLPVPPAAWVLARAKAAPVKPAEPVTHAPSRTEESVTHAAPPASRTDIESAAPTSHAERQRRYRAAHADQLRAANRERMRAKRAMRDTGQAKA